jgi:transcriptional regulator with XRE-family HTH domain
MPPRLRAKTREIPPMAEKIADLRRKHGLMQRDLAEKLGVHVSNVARIETGVYPPSLEVIEKLMNLFNVSADEIMSPSRKLTERDLILQQLMADIRTLDERNLHHVVRLVKTCKADDDQLVSMKLSTMPKIHKADT